ncbi:MAG: type II secretion system protein [Clostridia bacterium]|nr:type II secretion system protein [Clostridia bacterium]
MVKDKGFTLVEMMVALTVFSLTLIAMLSLFEISLAITSKAEKEIQAVFFAQEKLEEAKGLLLKGQSPVITGSVGENSEFTYVYEISPPDVNGVREIIVTIFYEENEKQKNVVLMTRLGDRLNAKE